jgi:16S rRNA (guanine966-N2)-methyltransferase
MRIIAGKYKGRRLLTPKHEGVRPTSDKIRGAIFNSLQSYIDLNETNILDLFCGTGALGLEALSRGAQHCTFIDISQKSLDTTRENVRLCGAENRATFLKQNASIFSSNEGGYDLILLDPPYHEGLVLKTLTHISQFNLLREGGIIVVESEKLEIDVSSINFSLKNTKAYGDTQISYLRYNG